MWASYSTDDPYFLGDDPDVEDGPEALEDLDTPATLEEMLAIQPPVHCVVCGCDREAVERDREYVYKEAVCCDAAIEEAA